MAALLIPTEIALEKMVTEPFEINCSGSSVSLKEIGHTPKTTYFLTYFRVHFSGGNRILSWFSLLLGIRKPLHFS